MWQTTLLLSAQRENDKGVFKLNHLTKYEELLEEAHKAGITVDEDFPFESNLKGLYVDHNIALSDKLATTIEKTCILAEELGHHYTSVGNILDLTNGNNAKQERQTRLWASERLVGLEGLVAAYLHGCHEYHETAEYLNVTVECVKNAVIHLQAKYGACVNWKNYCIYFEPYLMIQEKTKDGI